MFSTNCSYFTFLSFRIFVLLSNDTFLAVLLIPGRCKHPHSRGYLLINYVLHLGQDKFWKDAMGCGGSKPAKPRGTNISQPQELILQIPRPQVDYNGRPIRVKDYELDRQT